GDGMALLFEDDITAPAVCAVELARAFRAEHGFPGVRMGIHSGLVQSQLDIAGNDNRVGEGINTAQRVMDFARAGQILLSAQYAAWLEQFDTWRPHIAPLGEAVAKHGQRLTLFSLQGEEFGAAGAGWKSPESPPSDAAPETAKKVVISYKRQAQP